VFFFFFWHAAAATRYNVPPFLGPPKKTPPFFFFFKTGGAQKRALFGGFFPGKRAPKFPRVFGVGAPPPVRGAFPPQVWAQVFPRPFFRQRVFFGVLGPPPLWVCFPAPRGEVFAPVYWPGVRALPGLPPIKGPGPALKPPPPQEDLVFFLSWYFGPHFFDGPAFERPAQCSVVASPRDTPRQIELIPEQILCRPAGAPWVHVTRTGHAYSGADIPCIKGGQPDIHSHLSRLTYSCWRRLHLANTYSGNPQVRG